MAATFPAAPHGDPLVSERFRVRSLELGYCPHHQGYHRNSKCEHGFGSEPEPAPEKPSRRR